MRDRMNLIEHGFENLWAFVPTRQLAVVARTLFGTDKNDGTTLPMPKALTASPPTFDGKSEKFELFEDLFRNNIKMYPHLTEIQKINYFHSLLRGDALQAFCNIEDIEKDSLDKIMTIFKRGFGDYMSMAKARCEWDALKFDPSTQKLHEFLDVSKKQPEKLSELKSNNLLTKPNTPKNPTMSKKYSIGHILKTSRIVTLYFTWKKKWYSTDLEHQMR